MAEEKSEEQLEYEKELRRRIKILQEKFNSAPYQLRSATPLARDDALRVWNTV